MAPVAVEPRPIRRSRTVLVRRVASATLFAAAILNLASALTPPIRARLDRIETEVPLSVHRAAVVVAAVTGIALLQLARGVRRGQRAAWLIAIVLLVVASAADVVKGLDVEEAIIGLVIGGFLAVNGRHFRAPTDRESANRGLLTILVGAVVAIVVATLSIQATTRHRMGWWHAVEAVSERLVGLTSVPIDGRLGATLTVALAGVGIGLAVSAGWLLVRPAVHLTARGTEVDNATARRLVTSYGSDTLAYFALRDDKRHLRIGDTLIAYGVYNGICVVSPDPVGPPDERQSAWSVFRDHVTRHGWSLAVLGASEDWLDVYRQSGMHLRYIGDEAVVDVNTFKLDGGTMKGLRQAVNRIAKYGYTISFHDPATIDAALAAQLRTLMTESRQGAVERGFSMTLSRVFDRRDTGLLLAVCTGPDGRPAAFCQYVPAGAIDGYSLDLMRRSEDDCHPNGLTDFVVVRTIEHLRAEGRRGLSLNFATMRAVLAGEMGDGFSQKLERRVMGRLSESMQIETLWRYNAKFFPAWHRRYLVFDSPEHLVGVGLAVASAEQWTELPVIGRFLPAASAS